MAEIENRVTTLENKFDVVMTKLDMFIAESREARQRHDAEIRELRQRQEADMREFRERQEAAQLKHDADMKEMQKNIYAKMDSMDTKIDGMGKHVRNLAITSMAAIGGMVVAVVAMVVAVFLK